MKAVVDTNVFTSMLVTARGPSTWLFAYWSQRRFELVMSPLLEAELLRILDRPKVARKVRVHQKLTLIQLLTKDAIWIEGRLDFSGATPDPKDDMLVSAAVEAGAEFIVTWDKALLNLGTYQAIRFITPEDFIAFLNRRDNPAST